MLDDNGFGDRKPQACSPSGLGVSISGPEKLGKKFFHNLSVHADSSVPYGYLNGIACFHCGNLDRAFPGVLDGVGSQIAENLNKAVLVPIYY
ncbi:MAG: hypothetical protein IIA14_13230 [SAR324 cluster bacterium]|nr:hypothetical protein [SAR324 cluster bacterium]